VPARTVGRPQEEEPARAMDQKFSGAHVEGSGI
jgi:hypothetical protein